MRKLLLISLMFFFELGITIAQEKTLDPNQPVNTQIAADTLANGTHDPAKTVYKAESGQVYAFDGTLYVDFSLVIEGSDNTWIYKQATPPVFLQTPAATVRDMFNLRAGGSITVKNILFGGLLGDDNNIIEFIQNAAGDSIIVDNCVFSDHDSHAIKVTGGAIKVSITNCIFINGVRRRLNPFGGMPVRFDGSVKDILIENNTIVNAARELGNGGNFFKSRFIELHNTYVNQQINAHEIHWYSAIQANNIFYNWSWRGRVPSTNGYEAYFTTWEYFNDVKNKLDSVSLYNGYNLMYLDPKFLNYFKTQLAADTVEQCLLWNKDVDSTIEADNNFTIGKNYWQFDPRFATPPNNLDSMLAWDMAYWITQPATAPDWRLTPSVTYDANGSPVLNWPPAFNLSYSNDTLLTAGTDGLPLGDLNWFPDKKTIYETNRAQYIAALQDSMANAKYVYIPGDSASALITSKDITAIESNVSNVPNKYYLSNNYPNPFNPSTTIEFGLPEQSNITLSVFNILGQKVLEIKTRYAGSYR